MMTAMRVLGIETSCDETGVAIYDGQQGLLGQELYSQVKMHAEYGGVVPELASRDHIRKLLPLTQALLKKTKLKLQDIDAIAYTAGPGLIGALLVGAGFAKSLAYGLNIPCLPVHHLEAHLVAPLLDESVPNYPFLALLVSGGHTQLLAVKALGEYELLGETLDDAVGEAFDKTAKLMGLSYPGGPALAALALQGEPGVYRFPRPMTDRPGLDFSFSGLKTFALNTYNASTQDKKAKADIAYAFQEAVCETLLIKCKRALQQTSFKQLVVAGGVSANTHLRNQLQALMTKMGGQLFLPAKEYCTDNGAMVALLGYLKFEAQKNNTNLANLAIEVKARWPFS